MGQGVTRPKNQSRCVQCGKQEQTMYRLTAVELVRPVDIVQRDVK